MNKIMLKDKYNLNELTETETLFTFGGNGTLADEIGYVIGAICAWFEAHESYHSNIRPRAGYL